MYKIFYSFKIVFSRYLLNTDIGSLYIVCTQIYFVRRRFWQFRFFCSLAHVLYCMQQNVYLTTIIIQKLEQRHLSITYIMMNVEIIVDTRSHMYTSTRTIDYNKHNPLQYYKFITNGSVGRVRNALRFFFQEMTDVQLWEAYVGSLHLKSSGEISCEPSVNQLGGLKLVKKNFTTLVRRVKVIKFRFSEPDIHRFLGASREISSTPWLLGYNLFNILGIILLQDPVFFQ